MDYKKLSRIADSTKVQDSRPEELDYFELGGTDDEDGYIQGFYGPRDLVLAELNKEGTRPNFFESEGLPIQGLETIERENDDKPILLYYYDLEVNEEFIEGFESVEEARARIDEISEYA